MVTIKTIPYITMEDVEELTGKHWGDFEFAQMAENGSYRPIDCDDGSLEELYEDKAYEEDMESHLVPEVFEDLEDYEYHRRNCRATRLKNQIELVETLRKVYGIRDTVLVWISW